LSIHPKLDVDEDKEVAEINHLVPLMMERSAVLHFQDVEEFVGVL